MDESISRGYAFLQDFNWKYPKISYNHRLKSKSLKNFQNNDHEEEEDEEVGGEEEEGLQPLSYTSSDFSNSFNKCSLQFNSSPVDSYNCIYFGFLLAGVGFLLPYNSFVIAVDYFKATYPSTSIIFDMSFIYILIASLAVIINNILVETISLFWRINIGYILSFVTLLFVVCFEIGFSIFSSSILYYLNLSAIAIIAFGCTVQQSSFYGYTSMLPWRYTQAVMTGESAAGIIVSANRVLTKFFWKDEKTNTLLFFGLSIVIIVFSFITHNLLQKNHLVRFYVTMCTKAHLCKNVASDPFYQNVNNDDSNDSISKMDCFCHKRQKDVKNIPSPTSLDFSEQRSMLRTHSSSTEFDMPFGIDEEDLKNYVPLQLPEPNISGFDDKELCFSNSENLKNILTMSENIQNMSEECEIVNDEEEICSKSKAFYLKISTFIFCPSFSNILKYFNHHQWFKRIKTGLSKLLYVISKLWPYMITIFFAYLVTLSLFPGIESEIISCKYGSWMPVILMAIFNLTDFIGKIIAPLFYNIKLFRLMVFSFLRFSIIPFLTLCAFPRSQPFFLKEIWSFFFSALLGISNGILGSLPMILAPKKVPNYMKEMVGNLMTLSYCFGLTIGSLISYLIDYKLGEPVDFCFTQNGTKVLNATRLEV